MMTSERPPENYLNELPASPTNEQIAVKLNEMIAVINYLLEGHINESK